MDAPTPAQIFQRAEQSWEARKLPPYIEFEVEITNRDANGTVTTGREHVVLRTFDHWCATREIDSDSAAPKTSAGTHCVGPAYSPLGFNISSEYPDSREIDPFQGSVPVIASVRAAHYTVRLSGEERVGGLTAYHLILTPIAEPQAYPLRAVWVDTRTSDVLKLTYAEQTRGWNVAIDYSFQPFPPSQTWWVSQIDAHWTPPPKSKELPFQTTLLLTGVTFPASVPELELQQP